MNKKTLLGSLSAIVLVATPSARMEAQTTAVPLRVGDRVQTVKNSPVWSNAPTAGEVAGNQPAQSQGSLTAGPVRSGDAWWWRVDFNSGADGWIAERQIRNPQGQPPGPRLSPSAPAPRPLAVDAVADVQPAGNSTVDTANVVLRGKVTPDVYAAPLVSFSVNGKKVALEKDGRFSLPVTLVPGANKFALELTTPNPRQHPNQISAYLDGSVIYGSDATRAAALRTFTGGKLKTSEGNLMPLNSAGLANANDAHIFPDNQLFLAGDVRANENVELSAIHTLFVREHNQIAGAIAAANPSFTDEQVFQNARRIVVGELQVITYREFLPALLGPKALRPYGGYKPDVNPGIATEFSTAAYRIGHTLINDDVELLDNDGNEIEEALELAEAFFNPSVLHAVGPDPLLKYLATDKAQEVDTQLVGGLRNFLFGPPGAGGFDLASLNIQRGRDHGLSDYNPTRAAYGLPKVKSFAEITSDTSLQAKLLSLYGSVDNIDLWVGGLVENHLPGSSVGGTFQRILVDQFERLRDGDRFWYARIFYGPQLAALEATRLSDIIRRNTSITKIQDNVFFYDDTTLASLVAKTGSLPTALLKPAPAKDPVPTLDGKLNNPGHTTWGVAGVDLMRFAPAAYSDGLSTPAGSSRPSARLISNTLCDHTPTLPNSRNLSDWIYGWGQFIDHDLDLTTSGDVAFDIAVPAGDPSFDPKGTGTAQIYLNRSIYDSATGTTTANVQKQTYTLNYKPKPSPPPRR
ncbi:MAG: peroxidase family protein [Spartobacteria bacterium]